MTRRECLQLGALPTALAFHACGHKKSPRYQGYALIANHDSKTVAVIDLSRFQRLQEVPLSAPPSWVLAAPSRPQAYLVSAESASMDVLNLDNLRVERSIALGGKPQAARLSPDGSTLWLALREPDALLEILTESGARGAHVRLPGRAADIDVIEGEVVIAFPDTRKIGLYDRDRRTLKNSPSLNGTPHLVRFRSDKKVVFTANTVDRSITAIDALSLKPMVDLPLALAPRNLCFNSDGGQLFVTGDGMDAVAIIDTYNTEVSETMLAGRTPGGMAATTSGPQYLFVVNPESDDVTVISIDDRRVLAQIAVGQKPSTVLLTPDNEYALVLNEKSGDLAVIRLLNIREANLNARRSRTAPLFTLIPVGSRPVSGAISPRLT